VPVTIATTVVVAQPDLVTVVVEAPAVVAPPAAPSAPVVLVVPPVLMADRSTVAPGSRVTLAGQGCDPSAAVTIEVDDREVGSSVAGTDGAFSTAVDLPDLRVGRHRVVARCGPASETVLDVVLVTRVDGATTSLALLSFFVLLGHGAVRRQGDTQRRRP
jgi:hypothetical protein